MPASGGGSQSIRAPETEPPLTGFASTPRPRFSAAAASRRSPSTVPIMSGPRPGRPGRGLCFRSEPVSSGSRTVPVHVVYLPSGYTIEPGVLSPCPSYRTLEAILCHKAITQSKKYGIRDSTNHHGRRFAARSTRIRSDEPSHPWSIWTTRRRNWRWGIPPSSRRS